jgi:protein-S-isoprenylcysteine O-methyltransferase Ste14
MGLLYRYLIPVLWLLWIGYWRISAADVKPAQRHESQASRAAHFVPLLIAAALLCIRGEPDEGWLFHRFLRPDAASLWGGALTTAAGLAFSAWARVRLGRNWSAAVTVKQDHQLIRTGPYAIAQWRALVAVLIAFAAFWRKLLLEERWMDETFGDDYRQYRARTAALIPFLL